MRKIQLIALCCVLVRSAASLQQHCYGTDSAPVPCYPPYEDVAAGLVPAATSTCTSSGPACEKCAPCDANVSSQSHAPNQTTDGRSDTYWQSATVAPGESVNLTYYLGGAFEVIEVSVEFVGPLPNLTTVLMSAEVGKTFSTLLSYSAALCGGKGTCASVAIQTLPNSHQKVTFALGLDVQPADTIRLCLYPANGYVAVANVNVTARCACSGHASSCARVGGVSVCNCSHNSEGRLCDVCSNGYGKQPWAPSGGTTGAYFICEVCSTCYQTVDHYQNTTLAVFRRFVDRMNATLSSVDTLAGLAQYQQLLQALLQKAQSSIALLRVLQSKLSDAAMLDTALEETATTFDTSISRIGTSVAQLSTTTTSQSALLINLFNITDDVEALEAAMAAQIKMASILLNETKQAFLQLDAIAHNADAVSREQVIQAQDILSKAEEALVWASDAFKLSHLAIILQNFTIANLEMLEAHDLLELNDLYSEAKNFFENIRKNVSAIANESQSLLHQTRDPIAPDFHADIQYLSAWLDRLANRSQELWNITSSLAVQLLKDESSFSGLNTSAHILLDKSSAQRMRAEVLAGKAADAFTTANTSVYQTQSILYQALELLGQLNGTLVDVSVFKSRLDSLVGGIRAAQGQSKVALDAGSQAGHTLLQAALVVNETLQITNETTALLTQAYMVMSRANTTSSMTHNSTLSLEDQVDLLVNMSSTLQTDLEGLGKRASADRVAIDNAALSVNRSSSKTLEYQARITAANKTLSQLRTELSSLHPVPPERLSSINATLTRLEAEAVQNQALINATQQLILQLEASSEQLEDKYTVLQQQRDLLQQILNNLGNLDCRKQYSGTT